MSSRLSLVIGGLWLSLGFTGACMAQEHLGPLVSDYNPPLTSGHPGVCARCGVVHAIHDGCLKVYKGFNGWVETPYWSQSWVYGYYDYAYGRGPLISLGSKALTPGFRGFGILGSPGYGAGNRPVSRVDLEVLGGHFYPEARHLRPRWP